jgi:hypothetical protein
MSNVVTREERLALPAAAAGGRVPASGAASEILGELEAVS